MKLKDYRKRLIAGNNKNPFFKLFLLSDIFEHQEKVANRMDKRSQSQHHSEDQNCQKHLSGWNLFQEEPKGTVSWNT